jgi:acetylornithine/N-succinyldiaminopimelate aminotransferase
VAAVRIGDAQVLFDAVRARRCAAWPSRESRDDECTVECLRVRERIPCDRPSAILGTYRPAAPLFTSGRGCRVYDDAGRSYLDFASGIGVNALGHGDGVNAAIAAAAATGLIHTSNLYRTAPGEELAAALNWTRSFADRVFFCNSGAEANEAAFKFARRWARTVGGADKHEIVALRGPSTAGSSAHWRRRIARRCGAVRAADARRALHRAGRSRWARRRHHGARTAAIIVEPVQGEGGVRPLRRVPGRAARARDARTRC